MGKRVVSRGQVALATAGEGAGSTADWRIALWFTIALRLFYSAVAAVLSFVLHPDPALIHSNQLTGNLPAPHGIHYALLGIWERFDTLWYLHIAQHGYDRPMAVIFYPLYPAAIRAMSWRTAGIGNALLVSTMAAFFFFWGMLRLAEAELPQARLRMLLLLAAWPTSFILFAGYAESLTLALLMWAVIRAREGRWGTATLLGILAGVGRPSGVLAVVPLAVLALRSRQARSLVVLLTPAGLAAYWGWLQWSGRPSVVQAYRLYEGASVAPPWASVLEAIRAVALQHDALVGIKLLMLGLLLSFALRREVRLEDKIFSLAVILQMLMYTGRPMVGAGRYLLFIYPGFVTLGRYAQRWRRGKLAFYAVASGVLNLAFMAAFLDWSLVL